MANTLDRPTNRTWLAILIAPVALFPLMLAVHIVATNTRFGIGWADSGTDALASALYYLVIGVPVAFAAEFALIGIARLSGRNESTLRARVVILWAALGGALVNLGIWPMESAVDVLLVAFSGAVMGGAAALVFTSLRDSHA